MEDLDTRRPIVPTWVWRTAAVLFAFFLVAMASALREPRIEASSAPVERVAGARQETGGRTNGMPVGDVLPVAGIAAEPDNYYEQSVSGTATVSEVVSDRAFWLGQDGARVLAVLDGPAPAVSRITAGTRLQMTGGVRPVSDETMMPHTVPLDSRAEQALREAEAILFVDAQSLRVVEEAAPISILP